MLAGGSSAPGSGHRFSGDPVCGLWSQLGVPVSRSAVGRRVAVCLDTGAGAVGCAAGSPAYSRHAWCLRDLVPGLTVASVLLGRLTEHAAKRRQPSADPSPRGHGADVCLVVGRRARSAVQLLFVAPKAAVPVSRSRYFFLTYATRGCACAISGCRCVRVSGEKNRTLACWAICQGPVNVARFRNLDVVACTR